jgi:uncharacterized integral membrane protein
MLSLVGLVLLFGAVGLQTWAAVWCARASPVILEAPRAKRRWYVWFTLALIWILPVVCLAALVAAVQELAWGDMAAAGRPLVGSLLTGALFVAAVLAANQLDRLISARP